MFLDGYIGAPPTILVISARAGGTIRGAARPTPAASAAAQHKILAFMVVSVGVSTDPERAALDRDGGDTGRPGQGFAVRGKKASRKNTIGPRNTEPRACVLGSAPRPAFRRDQ